MKPLLQITTTRPQYEYEVVRPHLKVSDHKPAGSGNANRASVNMRRQTGGVEMNTVRRQNNVAAGARVQGAAPEANAQQAYASSGNYMALGSRMAGAATVEAGLPSAQVQLQQQSNLVLVPVSPAELHYIPANSGNNLPAAVSEQRASAQEPSLWDLQQMRARLDFVPGSIKVNFTEYASINIEYTGGPVYVPRSADPNFEAMA